MSRKAFTAGIVGIGLAVGFTAGCGEDPTEGAAAKGALAVPASTAYNSAKEAAADLRAPDNVTDTRAGAGFVLSYDKGSGAD